MSRALILKQPGYPESLALEAVGPETLRPGEVRIALTSIGLNRGDLLYCQNRYFEKPQAGSRVGFEGAGVVTEATPDSDFEVGDRVAVCPMNFDVRTQGCLAETAIFGSDQLIPSPANCADRDTGAIWMAYLTAWGGLMDAGALKRDETVVITAASSSVGLAAIQVAKTEGARVIATTSAEGKVKILRDQGADLVVMQPREASAYETYVEQIRDFTRGQGSHLVFDAVAGPASRALIKGSRRGGRVIIHGMLDRNPMDVHAGVLMKRLLRLQGYTLDQTLADQEKRSAAITAIQSGIDTGKYNVKVARYFKLDAFADAFEYLQSNQQIGKIVVTP